MTGNDFGTMDGEGSVQSPAQLRSSGTFTAEQDSKALEALIHALGTVDSTQPVAQSLRDGLYEEAVYRLGALGEDLSDTDRNDLAYALELAANLPQSNLQEAALQAAQALRTGWEIDTRLGELGKAIRQSASRAERWGFAARSAADTGPLLDVLTQVFTTFQTTLRSQPVQDQASDSFGAGPEAKKAAEAFNNIVAALNFKGFPKS